MKAWYFSDKSRRLRYGDNRVIRAGRTHKIKFPFTDHIGMDWEKPTLCCAGLHGSKSILDAMFYAPPKGNILWRVELSGAMDVGNKKIAAEERKYLWGYDITKVFIKFCGNDYFLSARIPMLCAQQDILYAAKQYACSLYPRWREDKYIKAFNDYYKKQERRLYRMIMESRK